MLKGFSASFDTSLLYIPLEDISTRIGYVMAVYGDFVAEIRKS